MPFRRTRVACVAVACLALVGVGCASSAAWNVPTGTEQRFREHRKVCRQLTDDDGRLSADKFESCMKRRGWRRQRFYERWFGLSARTSARIR